MMKVVATSHRLPMRAMMCCLAAMTAIACGHAQTVVRSNSSATQSTNPLGDLESLVALERAAPFNGTLRLSSLQDPGSSSSVTFSVRADGTFEYSAGKSLAGSDGRTQVFYDQSQGTARVARLAHRPNPSVIPTTGLVELDESLQAGNVVQQVVAPYASVIAESTDPAMPGTRLFKVKFDITSDSLGSAEPPIDPSSLSEMWLWIDTRTGVAVRRRNIFRAGGGAEIDLTISTTASSPITLPVLAAGTSVSAIDGASGLTSNTTIAADQAAGDVSVPTRPISPQPGR